MEKLFIEGAARTPTITFDHIEGSLELEGRSSPENAREFYQPVLDWMDDYIKNPAEMTRLIINLEHFNTSTSKFLMEIFKRMRYLSENEYKFEVTWMYEEDDLEMLDTAETYEIMTGLRFDKVSYPEPTI